MTEEDLFVKLQEQWKNLIQDLNSPIECISNDLIKQNENLFNYIENWLKLARQLLEENHSNKTLHLSQLKVSLI